MAVKTDKKAIGSNISKLLATGKPKKSKGTEGNYAAKQPAAKTVMATDE